MSVIPMEYFYAMHVEIEWSDSLDKTLCERDTQGVTFPWVTTCLCHPKLSKLRWDSINQFKNLGSETFWATLRCAQKGYACDFQYKCSSAMDVEMQSKICFDNVCMPNGYPRCLVIFSCITAFPCQPNISRLSSMQLMNADLVLCRRPYRYWSRP